MRPGDTGISMKHGKGKGTQLLGNKHKHNTNVKEYMQEELSPRSALSFPQVFW
jgi:hypothetical protein